jgi:predicted DNA-binding transcriptional regulator AlpA
VAERLLGVAAVAMLLDRDPSLIYRLRHEDERFPGHAVEIVEPKGARKGWREADILAYRDGSPRSTRARAVQRYLGVAAFAQALGRSAARVWQYEQNDPDFPAHAVELVERKGIRKGWREADVIAYRDHRQQEAGAAP